MKEKHNNYEAKEGIWKVASPRSTDKGGLDGHRPTGGSRPGPRQGETGPMGQQAWLTGRETAGT